MSEIEDIGGLRGSRPTSVRAALLEAARVELLAQGAGGVSLRAVARRAGVSHAAPKHHFEDRAGLLTAVAVDGFVELTDALVRAEADGTAEPASRLGALGRAYLDFGLEHPALFELMFRSDLLDQDEPDLVTARETSFSVFTRAVDEVDGSGHATFDDALVGWAFVHGLVVLVRDGALRSVRAAGTPAEAARVARDLTDVFTAMLLRSTS